MLGNCYYTTPFSKMSQKISYVGQIKLSETLKRTLRLSINLWKNLTEK